jgi:nucleoside-diphosphate-sugar epimerase
MMKGGGVRSRMSAPAYMKILIIGGTRNIGYFLAQKLYTDKHNITLLNRGISDDHLPEDIARLRCDRTDVQQLRRALDGRTFDVVIDTVLYRGSEAEDIVDVLNGRMDQYVFISTGQVYLVREGLERPFKESDYEGPVMPSPSPNTYDYEEWLYGFSKRQAEDVFAAAYESSGFPYTSLRLPMVNSERDERNRLNSYILRIKDGGPVLVPETPDRPVQNVYAGDVVSAVMRLINSGDGKGCAYNIAQNETPSLDEFIHLLGDILGIEPNIVRTERDLLEANGFLPDCSPFSDLWMSQLDNTRSKDELGMTYTPLRDYLEKIIAYYQENPPPQPLSYRRRHAEKMLVTQ